jgi:CRISPR-associated protein Cmr4
MRDASTRKDNNATIAVFGPETANASDHAGALTVSDARLLALPVRSFKGTFAWVTSPLLLMLANRDLGDSGKALPELTVAPATALVTSSSRCVQGDKVYLNDLDLNSSQSAEASEWAIHLAPMVCKDALSVFETRFMVVDDETMTFLWETATQIDTRIRIDRGTKTVVDGALWVEESLPPETLLIGVLEADKSRRANAETMTAQQVLDHAVNGEPVLQFCGKASVGRGRCRMVPWKIPSEKKTNA